MIRLSKSSIGNDEKLAVLKVLENEMLGMGQEVNQFENALSEYFKRKVVCVSQQHFN
jgi:dTDP-4-amino-4,6-dideoxygalactose transaminase